MTDEARYDALSEAIAEQFERYPFPGLDHESKEGLALVRRLKSWLDLRAADSTPRLLDVGCGTGHTTVALARRLPQAEFVGIDISSKAISEARSLARAEGLNRVTFLHADARDLPVNIGVFDAVTALGVLHHIPDFDTALAQIVSHLSRDGHVVLWLYGLHGRAAHRLNQRFLSLVLGEADPAEDGIMLASALLQESGGRFVTRSGVYTPQGSGEEGVHWLLEHPAWLADQMLPAFEQAFTLDEIVSLLDRHGLEFDHWFGMPDDLSHCVSNAELRDRVSALPRQSQFSAVECLLRPSYYLISGRRSERISGGQP